MILTNKLQQAEIEIVQAPDGGSMYIDIISLPDFYARTTIGSISNGQGYCDTEILDAETGRLTYWQHHEFDHSADLNAILMAFFEKLRDLSAPASAPALSFELPLSDKNVRLDALLEPLLTAAGS